MSTTQTTSSSTIIIPEGNLGRLIRWMGLALGCMLVGGALAVWVLAPKLLGGALAHSRIEKLNNQIQGVLEHGEVELQWAGESHVEKLSLADESGEPLVLGDLWIPGIRSDHWDAGPLPSQAKLILQTLLLDFDEEGLCSLVKRLQAQPGSVESSPFFDSTFLERPVHFEAEIAELSLQDQRGSNGRVTLSQVSAAVGWNPEGQGSFFFTATLDGGGELIIDLDWSGVGATFSLASLTGKVSFQGASIGLGQLVGLPKVLPMLFGQEANLLCAIGEGELNELGTKVTVLADGMPNYWGKFEGRFDGKSLQLEGPPAEFKMSSLEGLNALLEQISHGFPQPEVPVVLASETDQSSYEQAWTLTLDEFHSGQSDWRLDKPIFEGWLATTMMRFSAKSAGALRLGARAADGRRRAGHDSLDLGDMVLTWVHDPNAVDPDMRGVGKIESELDQEMLDRMKLATGVDVARAQPLQLEWTADGPFPGLEPDVRLVELMNVNTGFFADRMGTCGPSYAEILGKFCKVRLKKGLVPGPDGEEVLGWRLRLTGSNRESESLGLFYFDPEKKLIWTEGGTIDQVMLRPGIPGGLFETFVGRFIPWFSKIQGLESVPGKEDPIEFGYGGLVVSELDGEWRIQKGTVDLEGMVEATYEIADGWAGFWGDPNFGAEPFSLEVEDEVVTFEEAVFPIGSMRGEVDLARDSVKLNMTSANPLLEALPGEGMQGLIGMLKEGGQIVGTPTRPELYQRVTPTNQ